LSASSRFYWSWSWSTETVLLSASPSSSVLMAMNSVTFVSKVFIKLFFGKEIILLWKGKLYLNGKLSNGMLVYFWRYMIDLPFTLHYTEGEYLRYTTL